MIVHRSTHPKQLSFSDRFCIRLIAHPILLNSNIPFLYVRFLASRFQASRSAQARLMECPMAQLTRTNTIRDIY